MENKLQQLTQKLYDEGLEKGRAEADKLVADAKAEARKIVAEARAANFLRTENSNPSLKRSSKRRRPRPRTFRRTP